MRTTLSIADDVLSAAKAIAQAQGKTIGDVVSELARRSLKTPPRSRSTRNGIPLLARRSQSLVTLDLVNDLRDETS